MRNLSKPHIYVDEFPATPEQVRFWYIDQLDPEGASNNICVMWQLTGAYSVESIDAAFSEIIRRHEILRTSLVEVDGELIQKVANDVDFSVGKIDVQGLKKEDQAARIDEIARELSSGPFDISEPCLLRVSHIKTSKTQATLIIVAHHAVFDGYSIRVLGRELGKLVSLAEGADGPVLPELDLQYGDYALWRKDCTQSSSEKESVEFWTDRLRGFQYFEVEPDHPRRNLGKRAGKRVDVPLGEDFESDLARAARHASVTPYTFGCGVMAAALHRATNAKSVSYGSAFAGRNASELEDLIGVFINPLVFNFTIPDNPTFADVIETAARDVKAILAHADLPFDRVFRCSEQKRDPARTPLYSVAFGLQRVFLEEHDYDHVRISSIPSITPAITHDLNFQITGRSSGWLLMLDYDADRFDEATAYALCNLVRKCFVSAFRNPDMSIQDVDFQRIHSSNEHDTPEAAASTPARLETAEVPRQITSDARAHDRSPVGDPDLHQRVSRIWCDVLHVPHENADGNFFDLGGHSVLALRLISRIRSDFDIQIGIADFLRNPSLRGVTAFVDQRLGSAALTRPDESNAPDRSSERGADPHRVWQTITLAEYDGDGPVIVSVNQPFLYNRLAGSFRGAFEFVNIHIDGTSVLNNQDDRLDIDHLVISAAEVVGSVAKGRPVVLLGQCVDGTMALLIAQKLKDAGRPVALLAMIDSWAPHVMDEVSYVRRRLIQVRAKLRRLVFFLRQRASGGISWTEFFSNYAATKKIQMILGIVERPTTDETNEWKINYRLVKEVKDVSFTPYSGETLLLKTQSQTRRAERLLFGWRNLLPLDTSVFELRGWHENALTGGDVESLANLVKSRLARRLS